MTASLIGAVPAGAAVAGAPNPTAGTAATGRAASPGRSAAAAAGILDTALGRNGVTVASVPG